MKLSLLFESFLIDQQNPEADRKIGYQCNKWKNNACIGSWVPCRGKEGRSQCNFNDFQLFLDNTKPGMETLQAAYRPDDSLDNRQTAVNCIWAWRDQDKAPYNFRGHKAFRNGLNDHNDFIRNIGQISNDNYNKPAVRAAAGDAAFSRVDDTLTKITQARVADHGRYLITAAQNGLPGVTIVEKDMGASPFYRPSWTPPPVAEPDTPQWKTVDWEATIKNSADPAATRTQVRGWLDSFYRGPTANSHAKDHWQVLRSYKTNKDRTNRCRKP
ncbi:uncharacterized protein GLRG_06969 [Colletotrichum graminicola M1.001]|uniref:Uncharacterized protein n=1 Tax=Colletotrichum graminicola (strain M1.001 / M2 / FGSC 10212) TaxID=645133 RepID=E3QLE2_COLGM|nr:uncharacterized protein GLRG_06969 [Colletotrichum graminicola M1.001]EFQ31680.1 hypothetical protein GLRG_06969 [Colletotrichum graminicola M1.001]